MKTILLLCGTGASSGFMAANTQKAMKAKGKEYTIIARSDSELEEYAKDASLILLGPHLIYMLEEITSDIKAMSLEVPVHVIDKSIYGILDGEELANFIISVLE